MHKKTYGRQCSTYRQSKKATEMKTLQPDLSGKPNPGLKVTPRTKAENNRYALVLMFNIEVKQSLQNMIV